jgi:hypothetical protein
MDILEKWALIGFNGEISILMSPDIYNGMYLDACKIAERMAEEHGLICGTAIELKGAWDLLKKSAKNSKQEIK